MTYVPGALTGVGPGDLNVVTISQITLVQASDMTITDLNNISPVIHGINVSNLSSYQTVWSGVTRNILWVP